MLPPAAEALCATHTMLAGCSLALLSHAVPPPAARTTTGGPAAASPAVAALLLPPLWPERFDAEWELCCEHGTDSWHPGWKDHQTVSYDHATKRQTVLHTDMYGMGPVRLHSHDP